MNKEYRPANPGARAEAPRGTVLHPIVPIYTERALQAAIKRTLGPLYNSSEDAEKEQRQKPSPQI